jgi:hypothetical protein
MGVIRVYFPKDAPHPLDDERKGRGEPLTTPERCEAELAEARAAFREFYTAFEGSNFDQWENGDGEPIGHIWQRLVKALGEGHD